jgi:hypothetical protein
LKRVTKRVLIIVFNILFFIAVAFSVEKFYELEKNEILWETLLILPLFLNLFFAVFYFSKKNKYAAYSFLISLLALILLYITTFFYMLGNAMPALRY